MFGRVNPHFAVALKEIRTATTVACWLIGLALTTQVVVWSLITMTDIRFMDLDEISSADSTNIAQAEIVTANDRDRIRSASIGTVAAETGESANVNRQLAPADRWLGSLMNLAAATGTMGAIAILPLIGLGVVLAAGAATGGVQKTSGAFVWAIVLLLLSLPWSAAFDHVPFRGMFTTYATVTSEVTTYRGLEETDAGPSMMQAILFYGRHFMLPIAALAGVAAIALRFRAGVEDGLFPKEDYRLDPELEREVARIRATSLVGGGRSAGALHNLINEKSPAEEPQAEITPDDDENEDKAKKKKKRINPDEMRSIRQPSPGDGLRRPI